MTESDALLRAVDFLESRLRAPVKVAEVAEAASYSLFHFCRLFSQSTRQTPYEYLMRRRLSQAAQDLAQGTGRILDVALEYQFTTSEGFARAFRRVFGLLPNQVRQGQAVDQRLCMPRLSPGYLKHLQCLHPVPRKAHLPALELSGWMTLCDNPAAPPALWQRLGQELVGQLNGHGPYTVYGLWIYTGPGRGGPVMGRPLLGSNVLYFAGLAQDTLVEPPASLVQKSLPARDMVCFDHPNSMENLSYTLEYIFHTWVPHSQGPHVPGVIVQRFQAAAELSALPGSIEILIPQ